MLRCEATNNLPISAKSLARAAREKSTTRRVSEIMCRARRVPLPESYLESPRSDRARRRAGSPLPIAFPNRRTRFGIRPPAPDTPTCQARASRVNSPPRAHIRGISTYSCSRLRQSIFNAAPECPNTAAYWSMIPHGMPTNCDSARCPSRAISTRSMRRVPSKATAVEISNAAEELKPEPPALHCDIEVARLNGSPRTSSRATQPHSRSIAAPVWRSQGPRCRYKILSKIPRVDAQFSVLGKRNAHIASHVQRQWEARSRGCSR